MSCLPAWRTSGLLPEILRATGRRSRPAAEPSFNACRPEHGARHGSWTCVVTYGIDGDRRRRGLGRWCQRRGWYNGKLQQRQRNGRSLFEHDTRTPLRCGMWTPLLGRQGSMTSFAAREWFTVVLILSYVGDPVNSSCYGMEDAKHRIALSTHAKQPAARAHRAR